MVNTGLVQGVGKVVRNKHKSLFNTLHVDPVFLYDYNFSKTEIRIEIFLNSWIPLEAGILFGPKHSKTVALSIIRMLCSVPQFQP